MLAACPAPVSPPIKEAAFGRLHKGGRRPRAHGIFYWWVCKGWASNKHTNTLSPEEASFGAGPVPDPAVLVLDPAVLKLHDPAVLVLRSMDIH